MPAEALTARWPSNDVERAMQRQQSPRNTKFKELFDTLIDRGYNSGLDTGHSQTNIFPSNSEISPSKNECKQDYFFAHDFDESEQRQNVTVKRYRLDSPSLEIDTSISLSPSNFSTPESSKLLKSSADSCEASIQHSRQYLSSIDTHRISTMIIRLSMNNKNLYEYHDEILYYMRVHETKEYSMRPQHCSEVVAAQRELAIHWMMSLALSCKLQQSTLYLSITLLDCFIRRNPITPRKVLLLSAACVLSASKFEEIAPIRISVLTSVAADKDVLTADNIRVMEKCLLQSLDFNLAIPTAWSFREIFICMMRADRITSSLVSYLLELSIISHLSMRHLPSILAASCVWVALLLRGFCTWPDELRLRTGIQLMHLTSCINDVKTVFQLTASSGDDYLWMIVVNKYSRYRFGGVSHLFTPPPKS